MFHGMRTIRKKCKRIYAFKDSITYLYRFRKWIFADF